MSSALKSALTPPSPQNPPVSGQLNKPMHPQGSSGSFSQSSSHMPQNLVMPTFTQPLVSGLYPPPVQASAHPTSAVTQPTPASQVYSSPKPLSFPSASQGPQHGFGHSANQNSVSVNQSQQPAQLPPPCPQKPSESSSIEKEKPQSNGTPEVKSVKPQENHSPEEKPLQSKVPVAATHTPEKVEQKSEVTVASTEHKEASNVVKTVEPPKVVEEIKEQPPKVIPVEPKVPPPVTETTESSQVKESTLVGNTAVPSVPKVDENLPKEHVTPNSKSNNTTHSPEVHHSEGKSSEKAAKADVVPAKDEVPKAVESKGEKSESTPESLAEQGPQQPKSQSPVKATPTRIRKPKVPASDTDRTPKQESKVSPVLKSASGKSTRVRTRTQPYQSPLPELEIFTKMSSSRSKSKSSDDRLIVFYKNEFLAVRNSEGSFYICQALQNIYKSSVKLKIRWLSQDKNDKASEIYTPDFYDTTDFDCILTNLNMERVDKGKYRLPPSEKDRTDSILNRSLAAEKGEVESSLTEEHPDGLDLSLYKEESQLKKSKGTKRKASPSKSKKPAKKSASERPISQPSVSKTPTNASAKKKSLVSKKTSPPAVKKESDIKKVSASPSSNRTDRARRRSDVLNKSKGSPVVDHKKAKVIAKMVKKSISASAASANKGQSNTKSAKPSKSSKVPTKLVEKPSGRTSKRSLRK